MRRKYDTEWYIGKIMEGGHVLSDSTVLATAYKHCGKPQ
jgi:hypothetical protein